MLGISGAVSKSMPPLGCGIWGCLASRQGGAGLSGRDLSATLAQLVEQLIRNQQVVGSNPTGGSRKSNKIKDLS